MNLRSTEINPIYSKQKESNFFSEKSIYPKMSFNAAKIDGVPTTWKKVVESTKDEENNRNWKRSSDEIMIGKIQWALDIGKRV